MQQLLLKMLFTSLGAGREIHRQVLILQLLRNTRMVNGPE